MGLPAISRQETEERPFFPVSTRWGSTRSLIQLNTRCGVFCKTAANQMRFFVSGLNDSRPFTIGHPTLRGHDPALANLAVNGPEIWLPKDSEGAKQTTELFRRVPGTAALVSRTRREWPPAPL